MCIEESTLIKIRLSLAGLNKLLWDPKKGTSNLHIK